jgi:hypothetical protein
MLSGIFGANTHRHIIDDDGDFRFEIDAVIFAPNRNRLKRRLIRNLDRLIKQR